MDYKGFEFEMGLYFNGGLSAAILCGNVTDKDLSRYRSWMEVGQTEASMENEVYRLKQLVD